MKSTASALAVSLLLAASAFGADQVHVEWAESNFAAALEATFPPPTGFEYAFARRWQSVSHGYPEWSVSLELDERASASAIVRKAVSESIFDQLVRLREASPEATTDEIFSRLLVSETRYTATSCRAVGNSWRALRSMSIKLPVLPDLDVRSTTVSIFLHPHVTEVWLAASDGEFACHLNDPNHQLSRWAVKTLKDLVACR